MPCAASRVPWDSAPRARARSRRLGHPLSGEVLDLTERYIKARFGGEELDAPARRAYVERVRALKTARIPKMPKRGETNASLDV